MPDADDFDVEYFRNLLQGNSPKKKLTPPAALSETAAKKNKRPPVKTAATKATRTSKVARKKLKQG